MELKQGIPVYEARIDGLLIVPYGIETGYDSETFFNPASLLIVPYGIEANNCQYQTLSLSAI